MSRPVVPHFPACAGNGHRNGVKTATRELGRTVRSMYISPQEAQLGYVITAVLVVVGAVAVLTVMFVRHENRPTARRRVVVRRSVPRPRRVAHGDQCICGGTVGISGKTSARFGDLLGCTGCKRSWNMDGRRIMRRRPSQQAQVRGPVDEEAGSAAAEDV
jgi:hypothetical protein